MPAEILVRQNIVNEDFKTRGFVSFLSNQDFVYKRLVVEYRCEEEEHNDIKNIEWPRPVFLEAHQFVSREA